MGPFDRGESGHQSLLARAPISKELHFVPSQLSVNAQIPNSLVALKRNPITLIILLQSNRSIVLRLNTEPR